MMEHDRRIIQMSIYDIQRPRFALIIANNGRIPGVVNNVENDAYDIAAKLELGCNFDSITVLTNKTNVEILQSITEFVKLVNSPQLLITGRVVFVFFLVTGRPPARVKSW